MKHDGSVEGSTDRSGVARLGCQRSRLGRLAEWGLRSTAMLSLLAVGRLVAAPPPPSAVDAFKRLLDAPPVIERLVYRETLPPRPSAVIPMDVGISRSTNYAIYEIRWQTNAMSARTLESNLSSERLAAYRAAFTLWDENFWFLDNSTNLFVYHLEHNRVRHGHVPASYDAAWYRISRYGEIINLGLSHLKPGSVRWDQDRFSATGLADKKPMTVTGSISHLSNGIPCELSVRYSNSTAVVDYRLAYEYDERRTSFYPRRVSLFVKHGARETEYRRYEILSLKTSRHALPETYFDPDGRLRSPSVRLQLLTNDSIYIRLPSGKLIEGQVAIPHSSLSRAEHYRNRYFYMSLGLVTMACFRAFVQSKQESTRQL